MKKILILNFNTEGERIQELGFSELCDATMRDNIKSFAAEMGIVVEIVDITNAELYIKNYFTQKGYLVFKCEYGSGIRGETYHTLPEFYKIPHEVHQCSRQTGVPDFFCYKNDNDYFFAEVKTTNDTLRYTQAMWICKNKYPTKLIFVSEKSDQ